LDNLSNEVTDVLKVINSDYRSKNQENLKNSMISSILKTYHDSKLINEGRMTAAYEEYDYKQEKKLNDLKKHAKLNQEKNEILDEEEPLLDEELDEEDGIIGFAEEPTEQMEQEEDSPEADEVIEGEDRIDSSLTETQIATLKSKVLLPLKKHLLSITSEGGKEAKNVSIRSDVAIAIIKLIRIFPIQVFNQELIGTLHKIGKCLKEKEESSRTEARRTLCKILRELGPFFMGFITKELKFYLTRGFEVHTRNYTIFALLETLIDMRGHT
jgi:hypothetical protein